MSELRMTAACEHALKQMDIHPIEGPQRADLLAHIDSCTTCADEFRARKQLRGRLKAAVQRDSAPAFLDKRIRERIRSKNQANWWPARMATVAATLVICVGATVAYQLGHLRLTANSEESYITSVSNRVATIMRVGLRDHLHCAFFRKYPKDAPRLADVAAKMPAQYRGLVDVATKHVPGDFRVMIAHQCRHRGRDFVHLALKSHSRLLSVVIARKEDGESFETEKLIPALSQAGITYYGAGVQRFQIAAVESRDHLVYVISDLPQEKNMQIMTAMGPEVRRYLESL